MKRLGEDEGKRLYNELQVQTGAMTVSCLLLSCFELGFGSMYYGAGIDSPALHPPLQLISCLFLSMSTIKFLHVLL